ncbi:MAG: hypothetical protein ACKO43_01925 [Alphaproteobacteria bacterium]
MDAGIKISYFKILTATITQNKQFYKTFKKHLNNHHEKSMGVFWKPPVLFLKVFKNKGKRRRLLTVALDTDYAVAVLPCPV